MRYTIEGIEGSFEASIDRRAGGGGQYSISINGSTHQLRVLDVTARGMVEFIMDGRYHRARQVSRSTRDMAVMIDGVTVSLGMHADLDKIVYKNSGGAGAGGKGGAGDVQSALKSQIPGKVVSVSVSEGDSVRKGDVVCTLESMKMQVAVKSHRDGTVRNMRARESATVAKGDVIAEIE